MMHPNMTTGLHWLSGTFSHCQIDEVRSLCLRFFGGDFEKTKGLNCFDSSLLWDNSARLNYNEQETLATTAGYISLILPGTVFDELRSFDPLSRLLSALVDLCIAPTRLDLKIDDHAWIATFEDIESVLDKRDYTPFRSHRLEKPVTSGKPTGRGVYFGKTGKSGSGRQLVIYDKNLESEGRINALRWELRLFKDQAFDHFYSVMECIAFEDAFIERIFQLVAGSIDFRIRKASGKLSDRLPWFDKFLSCGPDTLKLSRDRRESSFRKMVDWIHSAVSPSLAVMAEVLGRDEALRLIDSMIEDGSGRLSRNHQRMITQARRDGLA